MSLSAVDELGPVRDSPAPEHGREEVSPLHPLSQQFLPQGILLIRLYEYKLYSKGARSSLISMHYLKSMPNRRS
jgi:hypothetical protein